MKGIVNFGKNADETAAILREPVRRICSHCGWSTTGVNGTTLDAFAKHRCKPGAYARPVGLPPLAGRAPERVELARRPAWHPGISKPATLA